MTNMKPKGGASIEAPSLCSLWSRSATGLNDRAAAKKRCQQCGGGWMPENISGVPTGRSVFHLTSPLIGRSSCCQKKVSAVWWGLDAGKYFWRSDREKCFSLDIPFNRTSEHKPGAARLIVNPHVLRCLLRPSLTEVPSLGRSYPASSVVRTSPPPQTARPGSRELPVDREQRSPLGLPVLRLIPCVCMLSPLPRQVRWN